MVRIADESTALEQMSDAQDGDDNAAAPKADATANGERSLLKTGDDRKYGAGSMSERKTNGDGGEPGEKRLLKFADETQDGKLEDQVVFSEKLHYSPTSMANEDLGHSGSVAKATCCLIS